MRFNLPLRKAKNMPDLLEKWYGPIYTQLQKADDPYISTSTGLFNAINGPRIFTALNTEFNAFAALPKTAFAGTGWRVITTRPTVTLGVAETGGPPDTVRFTFAEVTAKLKTLMNTFDMSLAQQIYATADDAVGFAQMREIHGENHKEEINIDLLTEYDTLASNNIESIDRVTATSTETTNCGATTGDEDIHGIDKSGASWAEGYNDNASGVDRALTKPIIRALVVDNVPENGGSFPDFTLTGHDTFSTVTGLFESQAGVGGALGQASISWGMDGLQLAGQGAGAIVTTVHNRPMVVSKDTPKDTGSRMYALDTKAQMGTPALRIDVGVPTLYVESGVNTNGNPWGIDLVGDEGGYLSVMELKCGNFKRQGKVRDLL